MPKNERREIISVSFEGEDADAVREAAKKEYRPVSAWIRLQVLRALGRIEE